MFVRYDGTVLVGHLGLTRDIAKDELFTFNPGEELWRAPECFAGKDIKYDSAADIFLFGMSLLLQRFSMTYLSLYHSAMVMWEVLFRYLAIPPPPPQIYLLNRLS